MKNRIIHRFITTIFLLTIVCTWISAEPVSSILGTAFKLIGNPYRTGGTTPGGFDCSGFISYLYRPTLPGFPRISRDMAVTGESVSFGQWRPGDLLFYATGADSSQINHVAIWFGENAIIHSISDGPETGVVLTVSDSRYWSRRYVGARRVLPTETTSSDIPIPSPEELLPEDGDSPWDNFDGILRGDFEAWQQSDREAFEAYKKENG
jgi:hypothetical protein